MPCFHAMSHAMTINLWKKCHPGISFCVQQRESGIVPIWWNPTKASFISRRRRQEAKQSISPPPERLRWDPASFCVAWPLTCAHEANGLLPCLSTCNLCSEADISTEKRTTVRGNPIRNPGNSERMRALHLDLSPGRPVRPCAFHLFRDITST
jgi:hypothetical protein